MGNGGPVPVEDRDFRVGSGAALDLSPGMTTALALHALLAQASVEALEAPGGGTDEEARMPVRDGNASGGHAASSAG